VRGGALAGNVEAAGAAGLAAGGAGGAAGGTGTLATGRATLCGVMKRGAGAGGVGGAAGLAGTGAALEEAGADGAAVLVSTGGAAGRAGAAGGADAVCCCLVISFSTSPGLEMFDRSILVLISSPSRLARDLAGEDWASAAARK